MRLREVYRYELEHRLRSPATWAYGGFLFLLAIWMFLATADGSPEDWVNAPERLAGGAAIVGTVAMLVTAALFGDAAVRDVAAGMDPLLYTSRLRKAEYLGGRFLAALSLNGVLLLAVPLGFVAATALAGSFEAVGAVPAAAYLQPYLLFLLPNLVLAGAVLFTIGALARHVVPVYLGALALFISCVVALNGLEQVHSPVLSLLADPLGMGTLQDITRYWTAAERNTRLVGFPAPLVWNRLAWLAVSAGILALLHWRFRFAHAGGSGRIRSRTLLQEAAPDRSSPVAVPRVAGRFGAWSALGQTFAVAANALRQIVPTRWFAAALLGCTGLTLLMGWNVADTVFDTSTWPVTLLVAGTALSQRVAPIVYALIALYAGELVWQDRDARVDEIADASPVPTAAALLGRFLALAGLVLLFQAALMLGGLLIQALQGYYRFELGLYLRMLFGLKLADYLLFAALALAVQVLVDHKYLGHIVLLLAFVGTLLLRVLGIVSHHLLLYGTGPGWTYSDMNGFGPFSAPFAWFRVYWAGWALLLTLAAVLWLVRGRESGMRRRFRAARARLTVPVVRAAAAAGALIVVAGGFVFYNTNILNEYRPARAAGRPQARYELRYARYAEVPQPTLVSAGLRVELHPAQGSAELRGNYLLVNRTGEPLSSVHVYLTGDVQARSLSFDRAASPTLVDEALGYRIYTLERALRPGELLRLAFDVAYRPRGFPNDDIPTAVAANGTSIDRRWLPFIGYQPAFELEDREARKRFGLPPRRPMPGPDDERARQYRWAVRNEDQVQVDAVIGTSPDQVAVTPGVLRRSWSERGRRYFQYRTEAPVSFGASVFSAKYAVREDRWRDVALRIFHHPPHDGNLDRMLRGMKASLEYYTAEFGPYPYRDLRIVEVPRYGNFGSAHPQTIAFAEDAFLSRVRPGEVDQPFYGTAHEVAHTWWGGQVRGAPVKGQEFLSESLANYSAMMVTEKTYGVEAGRRVYGFQLERYLRGRANFAGEVPLLEVEGQPYIAYRKGAIAMYTLRERIGEQAVNGALRRYLEKYGAAGPPYPTARDLYAELRAVTPDSLRYLLTDLFETVTLWDVSTTRATAAPAGKGTYLVTLVVRARKARADSAGRETDVPMDEPVEIGVFAAGKGDGPGEPLFLERRRIRSGEQTIRIMVPRAPARAGVDPYHKLIDRDPEEDNVVAVTTGGA